MVKSAKKISKFLFHERTLGNVIRFSAKRRLKDETVAEHSFHVALYSMILADLEEKFGNRVDKEKLIKSALLHDLEECMTGDIIFDFKHSNEKLAKEIKKMGLQFYKGLMANLPDNLSQEYINLWENGKNPTTIEGQILNAADKLEALMYSIEEYKLGNKNFEEVIDGLKKVLNGMKLKSLDIFMKELNL